MLFETSREKNGFYYFEPSKNMGRLGSLKMAVVNNKLVPLRKLVSVNPGEVVMADYPAAVSVYYGQWYALVRFLREANYGKRLGNYHQLLMGGLRGDWPLEGDAKRIAADRNMPQTLRWNRVVGLGLFKHYIEDDFSRIEKEYAAYCRKIVYHVYFE